MAVAGCAIQSLGRTINTLPLIPIDLLRHKSQLLGLRYVGCPCLCVYKQAALRRPHNQPCSDSSPARHKLRCCASSTPSSSEQPQASATHASITYRTLWDADNVRYTQEVWDKIGEGMGEECRCLSIDVFGYGSTAAGLVCSSSNVKRPYGGVIHVDISANRYAKALTDTRLVVHALEHLRRDPSCHFVIVSNDKDFIPLITALVSDNRSVTIVSDPRTLSHELRGVATHFIPLPGTDASGDAVEDEEGEELGAEAREGSSTFAMKCGDLADRLRRCSGMRFWELKELLRAEVGVEGDVPGIYHDLEQSKSLKKVVVSGLAGNREWREGQQVDVVRLMRKATLLVAEVGFLLEEEETLTDESVLEDTSITLFEDSRFDSFCASGSLFFRAVEALAPHALARSMASPEQRGRLRELRDRGEG